MSKMIRFSNQLWIAAHHCIELSPHHHVATVKRIHDKVFKFKIKRFNYFNKLKVEIVSRLKGVRPLCKVEFWGRISMAPLIPIPPAQAALIFVCTTI
jgi:hypothetical protein